MCAEARPRRTIVSLAVLVLAAVGLSGCQDSYDWRQKVTVTVKTPDGIVSGSAVQEISARFGQMPMSANEVNYGQRGEAVALELAPGHYLFALLQGPEWVRGAFREELPRDRETYLQTVSDPARRPQGAKRLPRDHYPRLVTFINIDAPQTVKRVDPGNLSASFGPGYRLQSITLEITDEPVTQGRVEEIARWYRDGEEIPDDFWRNNLTSEQRSLLSSVNWIKD